jgi:hypothetical protein
LKPKISICKPESNVKLSTSRISLVHLLHGPELAAFSFEIVSFDIALGCFDA